MLQDVEAAKPTEIEGLVGTVLELGRMLRQHMPYTDAVYACAKLLSVNSVAGR